MAALPPPPPPPRRAVNLPPLPHPLTPPPLPLRPPRLPSRLLQPLTLPPSPVLLLPPQMLPVPLPLLALPPLQLLLLPLLPLALEPPPQLLLIRLLLLLLLPLLHLARVSTAECRHAQPVNPVLAGHFALLHAAILDDLAMLSRMLQPWRLVAGSYVQSSWRFRARRGARGPEHAPCRSVQQCNSG